jgi:hypothetical protein
LPGKSLVVFDPQLSMAIDVFPCADGHKYLNLNSCSAALAMGKLNSILSAN